MHFHYKKNHIKKNRIKNEDFIDVNIVYLSCPEINEFYSSEEDEANEEVQNPIPFSNPFTKAKMIGNISMIKDDEKLVENNQGEEIGKITSETPSKLRKKSKLYSIIFR